MTKVTTEELTAAMESIEFWRRGGQIKLPPAGFDRKIGESLNILIKAAEQLLATKERVDPRDEAHIACDCVPELGPAHCHLCGKREGGPVPWARCVTRMVTQEMVLEAAEAALVPKMNGRGYTAEIRAALVSALNEPVDLEWEPAKWHELQADDADGNPTGDTIRLKWDDGTVIVGRLSVESQGSGHHQICRIMTVFSGDTYVWPHGSTLERKVPS